MARLQFQRSADGHITGLQMFQDGEDRAEVWKRSGELSVRATIALSAEQQQALLGDYASSELAIKVFKDEQGILRAQVPGQPAFELKVGT